jgi:hypothetical protein
MIDTILARKPLPVLYQDGKTEEIEVKALALSQMREYLRVVDDEAATIALFTGCDAEWVDSLTRESALEVLAAGEVLNLDFLSSFARRSMARQAKLLGAIAEEAPKPS